MGGCAAVNCNNHSRKNSRLFTFPSDPDRRKRWIIMCRRKDWVPGPGAQLCSDHFAESQFEQNRQDGWKRLKQNAVPTLFNFTDSPLKPGCLKDMLLDASKEENNEESKDELKKKISMLETENEALRNALKEKDRMLLSFLTEEQIMSLHVEKQSIAHWSNEAIIKALKFKLVLGKRRYTYLHKTGYPLPHYATLNRRISKLKINLLDTDKYLLDTEKDLLDIKKYLSNSEKDLLDSGKDLLDSDDNLSNAPENLLDTDDN